MQFPSPLNSRPGRTASYVEHNYHRSRFAETPLHTGGDDVIVPPVDTPMRIVIQDLTDSRRHPQPLGQSRLARRLAAALGLAGHETLSVPADWMGGSAMPEGTQVWVAVGPSAAITGREARLICRSANIPYVVVQPESPADLEASADPEWSNLADCLEAASLIIFYSSALASAVAQRFPGQEPRMQVHLPFIDFAEMQGRSRLAPQWRAMLTNRLQLPSALRLLAIGRATDGASQRSFQLLADALASLTPLEWCLVIAGAGQDWDTTARLLRTALPNRVRVMPIAGEEEAMMLLGACDLLVWPAVGEAYCDIALEAQVMGVPVVAGNSPGMADAVVNGQTGMLVKTDNSAAIGNAVSFLLRQPRFLRGFAERGPAYVLRYHDISDAARRLDGAILEAIERHRSTRGMVT